MDGAIDPNAPPQEPAGSPLKSAALRAVGAAGLAAAGALSGYILTNVGMDVDTVTAGVQRDPDFWLKAAATAISAGVGAGALWRFFGEGFYDEGRRKAIVAGDTSRLSAGDVGYPLAQDAALASKARRFRP